MLQTLLWSDELREPGDLGPSTPVTDPELQLAERLLSELTGIEMQQLEDEYGHAHEQLVAAKLEGGEVSEMPMPKPAVDLLTALEQSVQSPPWSRASKPRATPGRKPAGQPLTPASARPPFVFGYRSR
ncbi:hypothetical protein [Streptomyces platensis]